MSKTTVSASTAGLPSGHPLAALIERHRDAQTKYAQLSDILDAMPEDDPGRKAKDDQMNGLCATEFAAVDEILAYPVNTIEEARAKAEILSGHFNDYATEDAHMQALLRSFLI